jgi:drug/metabolite transporter (DMT)-like permease
MKRTLLADLGLVYAAAIWGSTFYIVKDSLQYIDPVALVGYRFLIAAVMLGILLVFLKKSLWTGWKHGMLLGVALWLLYVPQTIGLKYTSASNSGFITGLFILFVPLIGYAVFRIRPSKTKLFSIALALAGLYILTGGMKEANLGDIITLSAAFFYAVHILLADKFVKDFDPYALSFQQFLTMALLSLLTALIFRLPLEFSGAVYPIIFLAIFPSLSAFVIQLVAQKRVAPIKVALIFSLEPVFAAIFAWTLGGEGFLMKNAFGGLLIVIAMMISEVKNDR